MRRLGHAWWVLVLVLGLLALVEHWRESRGASELVGAGRWIWAPGLGADDTAAAFFAVRDFELSTAAADAVLRLAADEEYFVYLNGRPVGAGAWHQGGGLDRYDVGRFLVPGRNRLVVELRTTHGLGALLAAVELPESGEFAVVSDSSFRILRAYYPGFHWSAEDFRRAEPAFSWGRPPAGRWGDAREGAERPALDRLLADAPALAPVRARLDGEDGWRRQLRGITTRSATFDFGRQVRGFLFVRFAERRGGRGLLYYSDRPAPPVLERPGGFLVNPPGRAEWSAASSRAFRYVTLVTLEEVAEVAVLELREEAGLAAGRWRRGAFGLEPPPLRTPMEDEFWREFERLARFAGGEAGEGVASP